MGWSSRSSRRKAIARPASAKESAYRRLPNLNIIPEEFRRPAISMVRVALIVIIIIEAGLGYFAYQMRVGGEQAAAALEVRLTQLEGDIGRARDDQARAQTLQASIDALRQRLPQLEQDYGQVTRGSAAWSGLLQHIVGQMPRGVTVKSVTQSGTGARLSGVADSYSTVMGYRYALEASPLVMSVIPESLSGSESPGSPVSFVLVIELRGD